MKNQKATTFPILLNRLGIAGLVITLILFIFKIIIEDELQEWWRTFLKPYLFDEVQISITPTISRLTLISFSLLSILVVIGLTYLSFILGHRSYIIRSNDNQTKGMSRVILEKKSITNMDIFNALSAYRHREITEIDLATIITYAVNTHVITNVVGNESLNETQFHLQKLDNGHYFFTLKKG